MNLITNITSRKTNHSSIEPATVCTK